MGGAKSDKNEGKRFQVASPLVQSYPILRYTDIFKIHFFQKSFQNSFFFENILAIAYFHIEKPAIFLK